MAGSLEGMMLVGDPPPVEEGAILSPLIEAGESGVPAFRHPPRKMALRSVTSRGRLAKSTPKSPLMRMAEMRRSGLRGKALRQPGKKGNEGKGSRVLAVIPENIEIKDGLLEGLGVEGRAGVEAAEMVEDRSMGDVEVKSDLGISDRRIKGVCSIQVWGKGPIPTGVTSDCALDLVAAQPLQEMSFIAEQLTPTDGEENPGRPCVLEPIKLTEKEGGASANDPILEEAGLETDFPPLSKENFRNVREKGKNRGMGGEGGYV